MVFAFLKGFQGLFSLMPTTPSNTVYFCVVFGPVGNSRVGHW